MLCYAMLCYEDAIVMICYRYAIHCSTMDYACSKYHIQVYIVSSLSWLCICIWIYCDDKYRVTLSALIVAMSNNTPHGNESSSRWGRISWPAMVITITMAMAASLSLVSITTTSPQQQLSSTLTRTAPHRLSSWSMSERVMWYYACCGGMTTPCS